MQQCVKLNGTAADQADQGSVVTSITPLPEGVEQLPVYRGRSKVIRDAEFRDVITAQYAIKGLHAELDNLHGKIDAALADGRAQGLEDGRREARAEFAKAMAVFEREKREFFQSAETTIVDLGINVAESLVGSLEANDAARLAARRVIAANLDRKPYTVHVAPDAETMIMESIADLRVEFPAARLPVPRVDRRLTSGRAVMITQHGSVDLDVAALMRAIKESLQNPQKPRTLAVPQRPASTATISAVFPQRSAELRRATDEHR